MASAQIALPADLPAADWDARRGVVIVSPDSPLWAEARRKYDQLLLETPPIVQTLKRGPFGLGCVRWGRRA